MKNNKLTAKYIKDVFRFMEMYNITRTSVRDIDFIIEDNEYNLMISNVLNSKIWYSGKSISDLLETFKVSGHYMMGLV